MIHAADYEPSKTKSQGLKSVTETMWGNIPITTINELGMESLSNSQFAAKTFFCLQSEILEQLGLDQVMVTAAGCSPSNESK
jgi:putative heme iron utilization protein